MSVVEGFGFKCRQTHLFFPEEICYFANKIADYEFIIYVGDKKANDNIFEAIDTKGLTHYKGTAAITEFILNIPDKYINVNVLNFYADMRDKEDIIQRAERFIMFKKLSNETESITDTHASYIKYLNEKLDHATVFLEYANKEAFKTGKFQRIIYLSEFDNSVEFSRLYELDKISKDIDVIYVITSADSYKKFVLNKL